MSLLIRRATVSLAVGAVPAPPITGLISKRLRPKSLLLARDTGVLISASVNKLAAVPNPDCARTDVLWSVEDKVPVKIKDTTSACGNAGSEVTVVSGCDKGPVIVAV